MQSETTRRDFLKNTTLAASFLGLQVYMTGCGKAASLDPLGYGPLLEDPNKLLKLPKGFSYTTFSKTGERMDDGLSVPGAHDGMAAFPLDEDRVVLVRNHELEFMKGPFAHEPARSKEYLDKQYDTARGTGVCCGGTTTLVFNTKTQTLEQHSLSLAGTLRNCSGGSTPWGTWITCEETVNRANEQLDKDHGYCFEVPATAEMGLAIPVPIKGMGRFNHEAVAVDPETGIVYLTEDRPDGLIYRYIPNKRGELLNGGKLQALAVSSQPSRDTRNWPEEQVPGFPRQKAVSTEWIDLENIDSPQDDLRYRGFEQGAARFARGEGIVYGNGGVYFACTNGGKKRFGQIFKYTPSRAEGTENEKRQPGNLELFVESDDNQLMKACDNLTVAPWGDIVICEDDNESSAIVGVTPKGELYHIAHVSIKSELAGACFSPDGSTLFVNIQNHPGQTLAITGPWKKPSA